MHIQPILMPSVSPLERDFEKALAEHCKFAQQALSDPGTHGIYAGDDLEMLGSTGIVFEIPCAPEGLSETGLKRLYDAGVRVMGLTHDGTSEYGGGWQSGSRLTPRGMYLIGLMAEQGIMLDLSSMNHATARDALDFVRHEKLSFYPMASHAGCHTIAPHPQNFPDDVIDRIADGNGFVGIRLTTHPFGKHFGRHLESFLGQVSYAIYRIGWKSVGRAIAGDLCGGNFTKFLNRSLMRS